VRQRGHALLEAWIFLSHRLEREGDEKKER
jgi:hypothetical protein